MGRLNVIQSELKQLDGGLFQKLAEAYVCRKLGLRFITTLGSQPGTNKPTKGIPDAHSLTDSEAILIPFTTAQCDSYKKLKRDIEECISVRIPEGRSRRIVCCHLVWRLTPEQEGKLKELHPQVELLGPSIIAMDLAHKYYDLAADYLHIHVGVDALVTPAGWVEREERRGYATPQSGLIRNREKELVEFRDAFARSQIIVIHGPSGSGKTRLALELVNQYAHDKQVGSYVLSKMHGVGVAEDVNAFLSEGEAVLLVDDAQQCDGLDAVLETVVKNTRLRVVLTVREYAFKHLMKNVRSSVRYEEFFLKPLEDEDVEALLRDDYEITNPFFLEKIRKIARGNLRLAIMASLCAKRDGYSGIESAYEIMDLFYRGLVNGLKKDDLTLLSYLSVHSPCDLKENDPVYGNLLLSGMSHSVMVQRARVLHDRNILDLLEGPDGTIAIKFEQLNLRDYCIYKAIFEEHLIDLDVFIARFIFEERAKVVVVLNVLISVFGDEQTLSHITSECEKVWRESVTRPDAERCEIMDVLHPLIPDDAYRYACNEIDEMSVSVIPISEQGNYGREATGVVPVSLAILCGLKNLDRYPDAIPVLLDGVEKGCFRLGDYKSAVEGPLAINMHSAGGELRYEFKLLDEMLRRAIENPDSRNLQFFGLKLCEQYLALSHVSTEADEGGTIRFFSIEMPKTEAVLDLRDRAIAFLCTLLGVSDYRADAAKVLFPHVGICKKGSVDEDVRFFLESGIKSFLRAMPDDYVPVSREERELVYRCSLACEALSAEGREKVRSILPPAYFDREELMKSFRPDEDEILSVTKDWGTRRFEAVLRVNQGMWQRQELDQYDAGSLIDRVFMSLLAEDRPPIDVEKTFGFFCDLHDADQKISLGPVIVERIAQRIGWRLMLDQMQAHGLSALAAIGIAAAPSEFLTENDHDILIAMAESGQIMMHIDDVIGIEAKSVGFARTYCAAVKDPLLSRPGYASFFFQSLFGSDDLLAFLDTCFGSDLEDLMEIYGSNILDDHFDYFGVLFRYLDERGADPIGCLIKQLEGADSSCNRCKLIRRMGHASGLCDSKERVLEAIQRLISCSEFPEYDVYDLLSYNEYLENDFDVSGFIFDVLERGLNVGDVPKYYSIVLSDIPFKDRAEPYVSLLSKDPEGKFLSILPFGSSSYVGSGEEGFASAYREEIEIIESISKSLPRDSRFSSHRGRLHEIVQAKKREIERERWRKFHESI
ncbi:hypothetical protein [Bifidobacterium oedipodis]|uniref:AAA+ ATPase domain-containing protein n=1 Tax=Bifidobacterium oedipodis TaxID=2675322 RepID=A0A7Y0HU90_9BIFI|nr:hypothetical protein [Bifidobacterium sp. DSM 109957]NMM94474.1 hypothetical protein [Bifidobacterium sp. DSM 109957]